MCSLQLLGRWYEVAVVATCPYYMQAQKDNPAIVKFELYNSTEDNVVQMRGTVPRYEAYITVTQSWKDTLNSVC